MTYRRGGNISSTMNSYTIIEYHNLASPFELQEYEYNGKRYVRTFPQSYMGVTLSNGEKYMEHDAVWIEVSPVKWLVDEKSHMMITEKIIFSGVPFNKEYTNYDEYVEYRDEYDEKGFNGTDIKKFMDEDFSRDLLQSRDIEKQTNTIEEKKDAVREHSGEEAKDTIDSGISAYGKVNETYQEYLSREASKDKEEDDKTK